VRGARKHAFAGAATAPGGRGPGKRREGFTLLELAIAITILMIGMVSVVSTTSHLHKLRRQNRERTLAQNAVRSLAERMHARSYRLSDDPATWATELIAIWGPGGSAGDEFDVEGLTPFQPDARIGRIQIVTDETTTDADLGFQVGLPRDLDGSGAIDSTDVSGTARILPVLITAEWRSQSGRSTYRHSFYVLGY
jgi:Tfp pilus assembly protein PilV